MEELNNKTTIRLLLMDKKGRYDSRSWPNLFIGIDSKNDTIGIIENFTSQDFRRGEQLTFEPYDYGIDIEYGFLKPVFRVRKKKKESKLYCSIRTLYYAKLIE